MRERHLNFYLELAEDAECTQRFFPGIMHLSASKRARQFRAVRIQQGNGSFEPGLAGWGLWRFWDVRHMTEGRGVLDELPTLLSVNVAATIRAKALNGAGVLAGNQRL